MAVYGPGDIDPSTGQPYPATADPESVATYGLTLPHSGFGAAPATPMTHGIAPTAGYPVTESGAPTPGHLPNYGPWHAGGSPTGPTVADPNQPGGAGGDGGGGYSIWDLGRTLKGWMGQPSLPNLPAAIGESGSAAPGDTGGYVPSGLNSAPSGQGGIGSDANIPLAGGGTTGGPQFGPPQGGNGMPWAGNNAGRPYGNGMPWAGNNAGRPYGVGAPAGGVAPGSVNLGRGIPGVHPAVLAHAAAAAQLQQPNSPFTMIMRPNAPANAQSGRGGGGTPLSTALDLSGWRPQAAAPAPAPRAAAPRPVARAPVRGPLAQGALPAPLTQQPGPMIQPAASIDPSIIARQKMAGSSLWPRHPFAGQDFSGQNPGDIGGFGGGS